MVLHYQISTEYSYWAVLVDKRIPHLNLAEPNGIIPCVTRQSSFSPQGRVVVITLGKERLIQVSLSFPRVANLSSPTLNVER